jgi:general secretion pathway protein K
MSRRVAKTASYRVGHNRAGSALLAVLIMLGMIAVLAAIISRSVSGAALEMSVARASSLSEADLHAGIELGVAAILKLGDNMRSADAFADLTNRHITVRITNERARIDLNMASKTVLAALFAANGVDDNEAASLAASVHEWRGGSASQKLVPPAPAGGFGTQPQGLNMFNTPIESNKDIPKQTIGSRYFLHPTQLAAVPGFSKGLVKSLLPFVTVANGSSQIDPYIAPREVLEALPGTTPGQVEGFIQARDGNSSRDMAILLLGVDKALITDTAASGWRLEITSASRSSRTHRREAVVAVIKGDDKPYRILYAGDD